jgi:hypothetical protein
VAGVRGEDSVSEFGFEVCGFESHRRFIWGEFGELVEVGVSVGFRGFGGTVLNRPVNRAVHRAVNRCNESIQ